MTEKAKLRRREADPEQDKIQVLKRLEEKLAAAQLNREKELEAVRIRAASRATPRNDAVASRLEQRAEEVAQRLQHNLEAAERRRQARMDAARERLSAAHELVCARLAKTLEQEKRCNSEKRRRIHSRLRKADEARREQLAAVAGKAGEVVERARQVSRMARLTAEKDARRRKSQLSSRLDAAAERRRLRGVSSTGADTEGGLQLGDAEQQRLQELAASLRARHLQATWRNFMRKRKTTAALAAAFAATGVPAVREDGTRSEAPQAGGTPDALEVVEQHEGGVVMMGGMSSGQSPRHAEFESFAARLQGIATLRTSQALLKRLETRLNAQGVADASATSLLKRLYPKAPRNHQLERYPPRVFLCAYMILQHPEVVFSSLDKQEAQLSQAAQEMVDAFENLLERILRPLPSPLGTPMSSPRDVPAAVALCPSPLKAGMQAYRDAMKQGKAAQATSPSSAAPWTRIGELLVQFDEAWLGYLDQFVAWKSHDAESLVGELVRMGTQMELSLRRKLAGRSPRDMSSAERLRSNTDLQAMVAQVAHDHQLLRERIEKLAGQAGVERLEAALRGAREQVASESESEWETDRSNPPSRRASATGFLPAAPGPPGGQDAGPSHSQPEPAPAPPAAAAAAPVSANQQLVWELLYNPAYRLPSTEADTTWQRALAESTSPSATPQPLPSLDPSELASLSPQEVADVLTRQAVGIAERAFWDSVAQSLAAALRDGDLARVLGPMVAELGADLAAAMPEGAAAQSVRDQFSEALVMQQLRNGSTDGGGNSLVRCMETLQQLSQVLISSGAAAREADATRAQAKVAEALQAAAGASGADAAARVVAGLVAALRLLFAQLKLLKLDLANARLALLSASLKGSGAAVYLRTKFAAAHQLPDAADATAAALARQLPRSASWLAQAQGGLPLLEQRLQSMGVSLEQLEAAPSGIQQPLPAMHSGARGRARTSQGGDAGAAPAAALKPSYPVRLRSWQGVVRWAVMGLVVQEASAVEGLPEALEGQAQRLHAAQNQLQALLVATAALLITQQVRQRSRRGAWTPEEQRAAKARVLGVLRQPDMQLDVLVALLAQLAGAATPEEEAQIRGAFRTVVSSGSGAYRAISGSLSGVLVLHLLLGPAQLAGSAEVSRVVSAALSRSGATPFAEELAALAAELALLSAGIEAVHGPLLRTLLQQ